MVHCVFTELLPFDEICTGHFRSVLCNKEQLLVLYQFASQNHHVTEAVALVLGFCYM